MAFSIKTWVDRVVEHAGRKTLTNVDTGEKTVVDMTRNEGEVTATGDTFSAANMNDLETRISEAFGTNGNHYGTCSTAAATAAKTVTTDDDFVLTAGVSIKVKFTASNTASSPTLNVNKTGAKAIVSYGTTAIPTYDWATNGIVEFVYDGTSWIIEDGTLATTTHYGRTKLSSSTSSTSTALAATPSAVKAAYDLANTANTTADANATAISELNENLGSTVAVFGEIGVDGATTIYGRVVFQKCAVNLCNLHIEARIEAISESSSAFDHIDVSKVCALLGVSSITGVVTEKSIVNVFYPSDLSSTANTDDVGYGLSINNNGNTYWQIGRIYTNTGGSGGWATTSTRLFQAGTIFYIDIYGVTYS